MKHALILILIISSLLLPGSTEAQQFQYRNVTGVPSFIKKINEGAMRKQIAAKYPLKDITSYLPKNHKKNGTVNYTKFIQDAINKNTHILMPDFPILVDDNGISIPSNRVVVFNTNSKLILAPSSKKNYDILKISNADDVYLFSPTLIGDKYTHLDNKGEWGMGIGIYSSSKVKIVNPQVSKCWGDGIYLGSSSSKKTNTNIDIQYGRIDDNRRNGISVITVNGLQMKDLIVSNTKGTNPQCGIDFEPNNKDQVLKNIYLQRIYTFNNFHQGIFAAVSAIKGSNENISIAIDQHANNHSSTGFGFQNTDNRPGLKPLRGKIRLTNINYVNTKNPLRVINNNSRIDDVEISVSPINKSKYTNVNASFFKMKK